jgi:hypothetical protein
LACAEDGWERFLNVVGKLKEIEPNELSEGVWFMASNAVCLGDLGVDQPRGYNWFNISWARNEEKKRSRYYDVYMRSCLLWVEQTKTKGELGAAAEWRILVIWVGIGFELHGRGLIRDAKVGEWNG